MAEYIERYALEGSFDAAAMAFLEKEDHLFDRKSVLAGMSIAAGIVHTAPAADVAPVVHAHVVVSWLGDCHCSGCEESIDSTSRYCNWCGAILDEPEQKEL